MIFEKQILQAYRGMAYTRCDGDGMAFYFSCEDFEELHKEPYSFVASAGHTLQGYFYFYNGFVKDRLIVFDHGFGGGHRAYMKEIEMLCRRGFRVLAYDHTGCMESGGENTNGMAQSLCDLNDCISSLKKKAAYKELKLSVMGHSWGGFAALNVSSLHPEIAHVIVLSGFVSVAELVNSYFDGVMRGYRKAIMALERNSNPRFADYYAVRSLLNSKAQILLIYSENDQLCKRVHYDALKEGLSHKENVSLLLLPDKGHNPNYTEDAVRYLGEYSEARAKAAKRKKPLTEEEKKAFCDSWNWNRMTAQDESVWKKIFACLDR